MGKNTRNTTALVAANEQTPALRTITRSEANRLLQERAVERYHQARTQREHNIVAFEAEFGRSDRLDQTFLGDLQRLQQRAAVIAVRQGRSGGGEPRIAKLSEQLGAAIGQISTWLAAERAQELFAEVKEADYLGWDRKSVGQKGRDESVLEGFAIIDDKGGPIGAEPTEQEDGGVCLHAYIEPLEEDPGRGICVNCDHEFPLRVYVEGDPEEQAA